jgi:BlaI family transcriptional regulator, penicillinase repressor
MASSPPAGAIRHSILDLAPLELDCMNALWPRGEATVRDIQQALVATRPRAYTTIMTILDRLAQKGIVERRKAGRAWVYRANVSEDAARSRAIAQLVDGFFDGSAAALTTHLTAHLSARAAVVPTSAVVPENNLQTARLLPAPPAAARSPREDDAAAAQSKKLDSTGLETTLL